MVGGGCGSWGQVRDEMGLPEYFAMCRHWKRLPPLAVVAAAYFPLERREEPVRDAGEPETDIAELFAMVGQSFNG